MQTRWPSAGLYPAHQPKSQHFWRRRRADLHYAAVKRIIDLANEEANRMKDEYISTEHLFLAILSERNTPAPACWKARASAATG
jgi:ATP-dependent Clp protease ATP-binding subunit ClpA